MKALPIITAIAVSLAMAMPVAAHHMCDELTEDCPDEIGDEMEVHETTIDTLNDDREDIDDVGLNNMENLDPTDSVGGPDVDDYMGGADPFVKGQR